MNNFFRILTGLFIVALIIYFSALLFERFLTEDTIVIEVRKIEEMKTEDGELYYLIHTQNEILINKDNYWHNKSNTSEIVSKLRTKEEYKVTVVGFAFQQKLPFLLEHRNIIEVIETQNYYKRKPKEE